MAIKSKLFPLLIAIMLISCVKSYAQLQQFIIGDTAGQIATRVCNVPGQNAVIIAGYTYNGIGSAASNYKAVVMKVSNTGVILWQKTFGVSGTENLIQDMIITNDSNVLVAGLMGRSSLYSGNIAALVKFNANDGSLMWQRCLKDTNTTSGGEIFFGVAQLRDGTDRIVAVGSHNFDPTGSDAMICVFKNDGTFLYNEVLNIGNGDEFRGIVADSTRGTVYLTGHYVGNRKDLNVHSYSPGTTSGRFNWSNYYDFALQGSMIVNYAKDIFLAGNKVVLSGMCTDSYSLPNLGAYVLMVDTNGSSTSITGVQMNGLPYSNSATLVPVTSDRFFCTQSPSNLFIEPIHVTPHIIANSVVTEITSLSSRTTGPTVSFANPDTGTSALLDVKYKNNLLYMSGATDISSGFGNKDIYFVISSPALSSLNRDCDTTHGSVSVTTPTFTAGTLSWSVSSFRPMYVTADTGTTTFRINQICGDPSSANQTQVNELIKYGSFAYYPNPIENEVTITGAEIESVVITNAMGQVLIDNTFTNSNAGTQSVSTEPLSAGIYLLYVNKVFVGKLLKY